MRRLPAIFEWRGQTLRYETGAYNNAGKNERAVEVPIARAWLDTVRGSGLEVGNVLAHYPPCPPRRVVDLFEKAPSVENLDLFDVTESYDWVLSVSTAEHVGWDFPPKHPLGASRAIGHLRSLLNPGGQMLVTVPFGSNPGLDALILTDGLGARDASTMVRNEDGSWTEHPGAVWREYGVRTIWAEAVWIATFDA